MLLNATGVLSPTRNALTITSSVITSDGSRKISVSLLLLTVISFVRVLKPI
jgi:hypothetical protein